MTTERAIELLKIEKQCVERANVCGRDCANCTLVQEDSELIEMYNFVIRYFELVYEHDRALERLEQLHRAYIISRNAYINYKRRLEGGEAK